MTILHVDDRPEMLSGVARLLAHRSLGAEPPQVLRALSAEEALHTLRHGPPVDLLIQDLFLRSDDVDRLFHNQHLEAFDVIDVAKTRGIPVLILSNVGQLRTDQSPAAFQQEVLSLTGADAYLTKDDYVASDGDALVDRLRDLASPA